MKLRNFLVADAIARGDQKLFIHGAGVGSIAAGEFPYAHPRLGILVTFVRMFGEPDAKKVLVALISEDGTELARLIDAEVPHPPEEGGRQVAVNLTADVAGLPFAGPGVYSFVLSVDGEEIDRLLVDVA